MRTFVKAVCLVALLMISAQIVSAQWPAFPTPDVPKTADGKPDLAAAAPRMPDGKPDLSGIWENAPIGFGPPPTPPPAGEPPLATFFDVGAGFKEGLPLRPWAAELLKKRRADHSKDNPDAHCLPTRNGSRHPHGCRPASATGALTGC